MKELGTFVNEEVEVNMLADLERQGQEGYISANGQEFLIINQ